MFGGSPGACVTKVGWFKTGAMRTRWYPGAANAPYATKQAAGSSLSREIMPKQ
ncbi:MAG TPA: hypothetical protein PLH97_08605 [Verrucomicrobiota bacterium]|nr:hypothetical protein [Verrucomicrobiota bacterium]